MAVSRTNPQACTASEIHTPEDGNIVLHFLWTFELATSELSRKHEIAAEKEAKQWISDKGERWIKFFVQQSEDLR